MSLILATKRLTRKNASEEGTDAGPSNGAFSKLYDEKTLAIASEAESEFGKAIYREALHDKSGARTLVDNSLAKISEAFWRAEDTPQHDRIHELLHKIARWKHDKIGCYLEQESGGYIQKCAVALTHKKLGFSVGTTGDSICSICQLDRFNCDHSPDRTYWVRGGSGPNHFCKACGFETCVDHDDSHLYLVCPSRRLMNSVLHEVSIVSKPAIPTARMTGIPFSKKDLEREVGVIDEASGAKYLCHKCAGDCPGFTSFEVPMKENA